MRNTICVTQKISIEWNYCLVWYYDKMKFIFSSLKIARKILHAIYFEKMKNICVIYLKPERESHCLLCCLLFENNELNIPSNFRGVDFGNIPYEFQWLCLLTVILWVWQLHQEMHIVKGFSLNLQVSNKQQFFIALMVFDNRKLIIADKN